MNATEPSAETGGAPFLDTGLASLVMLARLPQVAASAEQLAHEFASRDAFQISELLLAAKKSGPKAKTTRVSANRLDRTPLPAIAQGLARNFFIIVRLGQGNVLIHDPKAQRPEIVTMETLSERWIGQLVLVGSANGASGETSRFDFTLLIPAVVKCRIPLGEALLVSFVLQIFSLITPLFFTVVMGNVLVHHGLTTLDVIAVGLASVMLFESGLSGLRSYVFAHTACRIDVKLCSKLFRHPITLSLPYFQARCAGEAMLDKRNIGTVHSGQTVTVKAETFTFTKYGAIEGEVVSVATDAIEDNKRGLLFSNRIALDANSLRIDGKVVRLSSGKNVSAEIKTDTRRVLEYFLSPLKQHLSETLGQRQLYWQ